MILVKPEEIIETFHSCVHDTGAAKLIADKPEDNVKIYICNHRGIPRVIVFIEGVEVDGAIFYESDKVIPTMEELYKTYIIGSYHASESLDKLSHN